MPSPPTPSEPGARLARRNGRIAVICGVVFASMVGMAFAAVPFYQAFCQATGFAGTPRRAFHPSATVSNRTVIVAFDTNVRGLAWKFEPLQGAQTARLGQSQLAFFTATNTSNQTLTGRAVYNVTPESAGPYFSKLECFCFTNQTLAPGQTAKFPVVYYVDPRFGTSDDSQGVAQITLSYTFFPAKPLANAAQGDSNPQAGGQPSRPTS
jgi:cytochrome c oxidase assembly protein subunit 11